MAVLFTIAYLFFISFFEGLHLLNHVCSDIFFHFLFIPLQPVFFAIIQLAPKVMQFAQSFCSVLGQLPHGILVGFTQFFSKLMQLNPFELLVFEISLRKGIGFGLAVQSLHNFFDWFFLLFCFFELSV